MEVSRKKWGGKRGAGRGNETKSGIRNSNKIFKILNVCIHIHNIVHIYTIIISVMKLELPFVVHNLRLIQFLLLPLVSTV